MCSWNKPAFKTGDLVRDHLLVNPSSYDSKYWIGEAYLGSARPPKPYTMYHPRLGTPCFSWYIRHTDDYGRPFGKQFGLVFECEMELIEDPFDKWVRETRKEAGLV